MTAKKNTSVKTSYKPCQFDKLTKQDQLLVYMLNLINTKDEYFDVREDGPDVIAYGIASNKKSLSNLLNELSNKGYVNGNGIGLWWLMTLGEERADGLLTMSECKLGQDVDDIDDIETLKSRLAASEKRVAELEHYLKDIAYIASKA